eukprot:COSAG06_NODE_21191_length_766_cov_1.397301_1_plen_108_part_00
MVRMHTAAAEAREDHGAVSAAGAENAICTPCSFLKPDRFAKTGSGQPHREQLRTGAFPAGWYVCAAEAGAGAAGVGNLYAVAAGAAAAAGDHRGKSGAKTSFLCTIL